MIRTINILILVVIMIIALVTDKAHAVKEFWEGDPPTFAVRQAEAEELLRVFKTLEKQIPTLSPSERTWLQQEVDQELATGVYTRRSILAMKSKEYQIRTARQHLESIINTLYAIVNKNYTNRKQEILLWTVVAHTMSRYDLWQSVTALIAQGIVNKKIGHVDDLYFENFVLYAQTILKRVVINYLKETLHEN